MRRILSLVFLALPAVLYGQSQFNYEINPDLTITITGYQGSNDVLTIPSTVQGLPVTRIGPSAFAYLRLLSVTIPESVMSIGNAGFYQNYYLTNVDLGNGMISIEASAFQACLRLSSVAMGNKLANLGYAAFAGCALASVDIPNSVTNVGAAAFYQCIHLSRVTLGDTIASIGDGAFANCYILPNFTVPNSVTSLGFSVFQSCWNLTNVTIGSGVAGVSSSLFSDCPDLQSINIDENNSSYSSIDGVLFDKSQKTLLLFPSGRAGSYAIPDGVATIGNASFMGCILAGASIPDSVTSIGVSAFSGCNNLVQVEMGTGVTDIGTSAFQSSGLRSVTIGAGVTNIGDFAFRWCGGLTNLTLGNRVTSIGASAFAGTGLISASLPESVTSIGPSAFSGCPHLASVRISASGVSIGNSALSDCPSLTGVYFLGNAPLVDSTVFNNDKVCIIYYLPGATGWSTPFAGRPALPISLQIQPAGSGFGLQTNQFGFDVSGSYGLAVVVEAATNLATPTWYPLQTNTLTGSAWRFRDPRWTNYPACFYRTRWP